MDCFGFSLPFLEGEKWHLLWMVRVLMRFTCFSAPLWFRKFVARVYSLGGSELGPITMVEWFVNSLMVLTGHSPLGIIGSRHFMASLLCCSGHLRYDEQEGNNS